MKQYCPHNSATMMQFTTLLVFSATDLIRKKNILQPKLMLKTKSSSYHLKWLWFVKGKPINHPTFQHFLFKKGSKQPKLIWNYFLSEQPLRISFIGINPQAVAVMQ